MSRPVLEADVLMKLRTLGDDPLHDLKLADRDAAVLMFEQVRQRDDLLPPGFEIDYEKLFVAQQLFGDYTAEILGALLLGALPQSYATEYGAAVLGAHGELQIGLSQRIGRTATFLLTVMQQGAKTRQDQGRLWDWKESANEMNVSQLPWAACLRLRLYHQVVRNELTAGSTDEHIKDLLGKANVPALNQEDLLAMMLMFSFVVFEVLDLYGITWTEDEQAAYLHLWDVVGAYLAIGSKSVKDSLKPVFKVPPDWIGLRPPTIEKAHCLLDQIRSRQWIDPTPQANVEGMSWTALRAGRVLVRALLDELEQGMPPVLKPLPVAVMRAINPELVCKRLNLGGNGVLLQSLNLLPKQKVRVARFTSIETPNKFAGRVLRALANDVTSRASVHLGQKFDLSIPGAPDWHRTA